VPFIPINCRCPVTNAVVTGWIAEVRPNGAFETIECSLCNRDHLINRLTRETLDKREGESASDVLIFTPN